MIDAFATKLKLALTEPLPGLSAHQKLASHRVLDIESIMKDVKNPRYGSVLILLYEHQNTLFTSLMMRPQYEGVHSGQVSFPGGKREDNESPKETALRESHEELGIIPTEVEIIGQLSEIFIPPSRFLVTPFVGKTRARPNFQLDPFEVESLIEVPLSVLFNDQIQSIQQITLPMGRGLYEAPCFQYNNHIIWGATAMIINELKTLAKPFLSAV